MKDCDCITNKISMGLRFLFLDRWSLSIFIAAWAEKISFEVYKEFLTTLFSMGLGKAELLSNYGRLSELELRKNSDTFLHFVF